MAHLNVPDEHLDEAKALGLGRLDELRRGVIVRQAASADLSAASAYLKSEGVSESFAAWMPAAVAAVGPDAEWYFGQANAAQLSTERGWRRFVLFWRGLLLIVLSVVCAGLRVLAIPTASAYKNRLNEGQIGEGELNSLLARLDDVVVALSFAALILGGIGLADLAQRKGHHRAYGLLVLVFPLGVIIVALLEDRNLVEA